MSDGTKAVLIGDLNMLRSFKSMHDDTLLVVTDPDDVSRHSRFCSRSKVLDVARLDDREIVESLISIAREFDEAPVLFYGDDRLLFALSRYRERLQPHFRMLMPESSLIESCTDKVRFVEIAERHELPVPRSQVFSGSADLSRIESDVGYPCIIKPAIHLDWFETRAIQAQNRPSKILLAKDREELEAWLGYFGADDKLLIQEYIPGDESQVFSFHTFVDADGRLLAFFTGRKIRTYPSTGGLSTYLELVHDDDLRELGFETVRRLGVKGPLKIDFKRHPVTGKYYILELNLRYTLWNYLGTANGVNIPLLAFHYLAGRNVAAPATHETHTRWLSFGDDLRSFIRYYRPEGQYTTLSWLRSLMHKKVYDVFSWDDPLPLIAAIAGYGKAFFTKLGNR